MEIKLGENYKLVPDPYCWIVKERKVHKKTGVERWEDKWFYGNIRQAARDMGDHHLKSDEVQTIAEAVEKLNDITEWMIVGGRDVIDAVAEEKIAELEHANRELELKLATYKATMKGLESRLDGCECGEQWENGPQNMH